MSQILRESSSLSLISDPSQLNWSSLKSLEAKPEPTDVFSILIEMFRVPCPALVPLTWANVNCWMHLYLQQRTIKLNSFQVLTVTLWQWYPVNNLQTDLSWRLASKLAKNIELVSISAGRLMYISHLLYLFLKIMIWHLDFGSCCSAYCTLVRKLWNWTTRNIRLRAETGKD